MTLRAESRAYSQSGEALALSPQSKATVRHVDLTVTAA